MKHRALFAAAAGALLCLLAAGAGLAAPMPPQIIVNDDTKQCAMIMGGDECSYCEAPEGWVVVGYESMDDLCPAGYAVVEGVAYECTHSRGEFCCSEGHSGVEGDCADVVINDQARQCAFFAPSSSCSLTPAWRSLPTNASTYTWVCPAGYDWTALDCAALAASAPEQDARRLLWLAVAGGAVVLASAALLLWRRLRTARKKGKP